MRLGGAETDAGSADEGCARSSPARRNTLRPCRRRAARSSTTSIRSRQSSCATRSRSWPRWTTARRSSTRRRSTTTSSPATRTSTPSSSTTRPTRPPTRSCRSCRSCPEAGRDPARRRPQAAAVDGQPRRARAPRGCADRRRARSPRAGSPRWSRRIRATLDELLDAIDPTRPFDLVSTLTFPLPATIIFSLHRRAAGGLRAAQGVVRPPRGARLGTPRAGGAGRARDEHGRLPRLPARPRRGEGERPRRRLRQRAARHPRRGPGRADARGDRLDPVLAELRRPRDDELPDRQRRPAAARGSGALGRRSSPIRH